MIFKDNYGGAELVNTAEYIHISRDGTACRVSEPVLKEHLLRVYVNPAVSQCALYVRLSIWGNWFWDGF